MKNLRTSQKLLLSFFIIILLTIIVGVTGIIGMRYIDNASGRMYEEYTRPLSYLSYSIEYLQEMRFLASDYIVVTTVVYDPARIDAIGERVEELVVLLNNNLDLFAQMLTDPDAISRYGEVRYIINSEFVPFLRSSHGLALAHDPIGIYVEMGMVADAVETILRYFNEIFAIRVDLAADGKCQ